MRKVIRFLKEARAELAKVVWPTRSRATRLTVVVIVATTIYGAFIAGVDFGLNKGIQYVIDNAQKKQTPAPAGGAQPGGDQSGGAGGAPVQIPAGGGQPAPAGQPAVPNANPGQ